MQTCLSCLRALSLDNFNVDTRNKNKNKIVYKKKCKSCVHEHYRKRYTEENIVKSICENCHKEFSFNSKLCPDQRCCSRKCAGSLKAVLDYSKSHIQEIQSWVDGLMLSDIHIRPDGSFSWNVKHLEFAQFIADKLQNYKPILKQQKNGIWSGRTKTHLDIKNERKRWYPQDKKIVPIDVRIDRDSLVAMYLGDGFLHKVRGHINIASLSFSKEHNNYLADKISALGIPARVVENHKNQYFLYFSRPSAEKLLEFLIKSPIKCYEYKFDMPDRQAGREYQRRNRRERIERQKLNSTHK